MDTAEYQTRAHETAVYPTENRYHFTPAQNYALTGLAGEAGELMNLKQKALRGDFGDHPTSDQEFFKRLIDELGGIFWYLAEVCTVFGLPMEYVMEKNLEKLADRQERGVIKGSGDER